MDITATPEDFLAWISEALRLEQCEFSNGTYFFYSGVRSDNGSAHKYKLSQSRLEKAIQNLSAKEEREETILYQTNSYEVLVSERSSLLRPLLRRVADEIVQHDQDNDITYTLSRPTDEYLLFLMYKISERAPLRAVWPPYLMGLGGARGLPDSERDVLNILRSASRRFLTLQLESPRNRSVGDFSKYANSFLFQISYNLDTALSPQFYLDELVRAGRIARVRRARNAEELEAPKRHYIPDIVYHYQMGVATENPPLEYLSYYHVAEHFFEEVFKDDLINRVQDLITRPDFSYRSRRNINRLLNEITERVKIRDERVSFNEREALKLTIQRHVDLEELSEEIRSYDESLLKYYKNHKVPFSNGNLVDLEDTDTSRTLDAIASRIYKTRNSIVHSKEGEKGRYIPFRHDRVLVREVPLVRFIAESVILSTSDIID